MADLAWERFGDVPNYVEPFAGSLAVLLARPHEPGTETVNDMDAFISNFWRALQADPDGVAHHADWPVNETDLEARHKWLVQVDRKRAFVDVMRSDPDHYCVKTAGWWVWGVSSWIGSGWCSGEWYGEGSDQNAGRGINLRDPEHGGKLPHLGDAGKGVNKTSQPIQQYLRQLAERLRRVRVCCGDWSRVTGPSVTFNHGMTGVFLDPPYAAEADRDMVIYSQDSGSVAHEVRAWAIANGGNPLMRIALCGYEGEHEMPDTWECVAWKAAGGFGSQGQGRGRENAGRERIWFSPHCLRLQDRLF